MHNRTRKGDAEQKRLREKLHRPCLCLRKIQREPENDIDATDAANRLRLSVNDCGVNIQYIERRGISEVKPNKSSGSDGRKMSSPAVFAATIPCKVEIGLVWNTTLCALTLL